MLERGCSETRNNLIQYIITILICCSYFYDPNYGDQISFTTFSGVTFLSKSHLFESQLNFSLANQLLSDRTYLLLAIGLSISAYILFYILWFLVYRVSGMRVVIQSMIHYFGFKSKIFKLSFENNPKYFDSLPLSLLEWRIQSKIMTGVSIIALFRKIMFF